MKIDTLQRKIELDYLVAQLNDIQNDIQTHGIKELHIYQIISILKVTLYAVALLEKKVYLDPDEIAKDIDERFGIP